MMGTVCYVFFMALIDGILFLFRFQVFFAENLKQNLLLNMSVLFVILQEEPGHFFLQNAFCSTTKYSNRTQKSGWNPAFLPNTKKHGPFKKNILYFCKKNHGLQHFEFSGYLFKSHPFKGARSSSMFRFPQLHHTTLKPRCQEEGDSQKGLRARRLRGFGFGRFQGSISVMEEIQTSTWDV